MSSPNKLASMPEVVSRKKILIVEDHPATMSALSIMLSKAFPNCLLLAAASGEAAVTLCGTERPTVVIMDISLPGMNGIAATREIKLSTPNTAVVIHSSNDLQVYRDGATGAGTVAFVSKCDTANDLVPTIAALLEI